MSDCMYDCFIRIQTKHEFKHMIHGSGKGVDREELYQKGIVIKQTYWHVSVKLLSGKGL